jgi:hypothetical protein
MSSHSNAILPLRKLLKCHPKKKEVDVPTDLLPRLDLTGLQQVIKFDLNHNFKVKVTATPDSANQRLWVYMLVCPAVSDWPEPTRSFRALYCAALCAASDSVDMAEAERELDQKNLCSTEYHGDDEEDDGVAYYSSHRVVGPLNKKALLGYNLPMPADGGELLELLRRRLDAIYNELPKVIEILSIGPIPGTTPQWLEEPE